MVVCGGFIGIEVAENLRDLGIDVTLVEAADNICSGDSHYTGGQGSSVIKIFDMTAASKSIQSYRT